MLCRVISNLLSKPLESSGTLKQQLLFVLFFFALLFNETETVFFLSDSTINWKTVKEFNWLLQQLLVLTPTLTLTLKILFYSMRWNKCWLLKFFHLFTSKICPKEKTQRVRIYHNSTTTASTISRYYHGDTCCHQGFPPLVLQTLASFLLAVSSGGYTAVEDAA